MRRVQVVPRGTFRLYAAMVAKEVELARKGRGTFRHSGRRRKDRSQWFHARFPGRLSLKRVPGEVVEIIVKSNREAEWQLLGAILGFVDRHFGPKLRAVNIQYGS